MKKILFLTLFFVAVTLSFSNAFAWPGRVVSVKDGDTITVERHDGTQERIRLFGVDSPETVWPGRWETQPYGRAAADFVKDLFRQKQGSAVDVAVWEMGESYNRLVGGVITLHNGKTVQEELVQAGLAWVDPKYCKRTIVRECANWFRLQQEAADARRGLWRDLDSKRKPVAPWKWRRGEVGE